MKQWILFICGMVFTTGFSFSQSQITIKNMEWPEGSDILVTMENDTGFLLDINQLFHSKSISQTDNNSTFIYYPVVLGENFINQLKERNITIDTSNLNPDLQNIKYKTLWSGIHSSLGGGWVHFINCILYSLETEQLILTAPLLKRQESNWKPKPVTESYKRTKKWKYYIPVSQKEAIKEYKTRKKTNQLNDLHNIPEEYIQLCLSTNDRKLSKMKMNREYQSLAKINLVKLLLGSNYLGIPQIHYIKSMVLKSIMQYSYSNPVPSIIIFDDIEAAVAMRLDLYGYHIEKVAFKNESRLTEKDYQDKLKLLNTIISGINEINKRLFEEKLEKYYE